MAPPTRFEVDTDDHTPLVEALTAAAETRKGWVNVQPIAADDEPANRSGTFGILGPRIPDLALGTWTPPDLRRADDPALLGIQHPIPQRALPVLARDGLERPASWRIVQDAVRRGLVLRVPLDTPPADVAAWLLRATVILTQRPTTGRWTVTVHPGR